MTKHNALVLDQVFETISERHADYKAGQNSDSRTVKMFERGTKKIAQKVGEEAVETVIEAVAKRKGHLVEESADLLYFLMVLWKDRGVEIEDIWSEIARRHNLPEADERKSRLK